ncbi:hypothetical protein [Streptomyces coffeae]|nr:hypothetical protein [Streptomyces coffeae]
MSDYRPFGDRTRTAVDCSVRPAEPPRGGPGTQDDEKAHHDDQDT